MQRREWSRDIGGCRLGAESETISPPLLERRRYRILYLLLLFQVLFTDAILMKKIARRIY